VRAPPARITISPFNPDVSRLATFFYAAAAAMGACSQIRGAQFEIENCFQLGYILLAAFILSGLTARLSKYRK
jgi:hypothetical protein